MTKTIAQVLKEYRDTINVMLSNQPNFSVNDGEIDSKPIPNTPETRRILKLIPSVHKRYSYEEVIRPDMSVVREDNDESPDHDSKSVVARIYVTPAAAEVIETVGRELLEIIEKAEADALIPPPIPDDPRFSGEFGQSELLMAEALLKEIEDEEG